MKMTAREKIMVLTLLVFAFIALSYFYLYKPQMAKISQLENEKAAILAVIQSLDTELQSGSNLENDVLDITTKVAEKTKHFFPEQLQDKLIFLFDDILAKTDTVSDSYTFSPLILSLAPASAVPAVNQSAGAAAISSARDLAAQYNMVTGGIEPVAAEVPSETATGNATDAAQVMYMNVKLQISGSYDGVINFIKELESLNKAIRVNDLSITKDEAGMAAGSISVDFYTLPLIVDEG